MSRPAASGSALVVSAVLALGGAGSPSLVTLEVDSRPVSSGRMPLTPVPAVKKILTGRPTTSRVESPCNPPAS